jgi:hypothetical protein
MSANLLSVIPAKAGIQLLIQRREEKLDSRFRGSDERKGTENA